MPCHGDRDPLITYIGEYLRNGRLCESKIMCRIEVRVLNEALKDMDNSRDAELRSKWIC